VAVLRIPEGNHFALFVREENLHRRIHAMSSRTMQALNYVGPFTVKVQEVEMPRLEHPDDIIVKVTSVGA
jgi:hypothetical protein